MSYTHRFHEKVHLDFEEAYEWYEDKKTGLGNEFLDGVETKIAEIFANPTYFGSKGNAKYREALIDRFPFLSFIYFIPKEKKY